MSEDKKPRFSKAFEILSDFVGAKEREDLENKIKPNESDKIA